MLRFLGWTLAVLVVAALVATFFLATFNQSAIMVGDDGLTPAAEAPPPQAAAPPPASAPAEAEELAAERPRDTYAYSVEPSEVAPRGGVVSSLGPGVSAAAPDVSADALRDCARSNLWGTPGCPSLNDAIAIFSRRGEIAFTSIPERMRFRRTYVVRAAASRATGDDHLTEGAAAESVAAASRGADVEVQAAALLPALEMELAGAGFEITPLQAHAEQALLDDTPAEWSWRVRPTAGGTHDLTLTAWGVMRFGEGITPVQVRTIHHTVTVEVELQDRLAVAGDYMLLRWEAVAGIVGAAGAAGGGLWGLLRFLRRRRRS